MDPNVQQHVASNKPLWELVWTAIAGLLTVTFTVLGTLLKMLWSKLVKTVDSKASQDDHDALCAIVEKKADKTEVAIMHKANTDKLDTILENQRASDTKRDLLFDRVTAVAQDLAVLKDRSDREDRMRGIPHPIVPPPTRES